MQSALQSTAEPCGLPVIVIGTGPVGMHFACRLAERMPEQKIVLFGNEPYLPYDRIRLSDLLAGRVVPDSLFDASTAENGRIDVFHNCPIVRIDPAGRYVEDDSGHRYGFTRLVIATGSQPFLPNVPGIQLKRVYTFRDLRDTEHLVARRASSHHTVVVGGGLLGVETAKAMARDGTAVTIVQQAPHLMNRQLDASAAEYLKQSLQDCGVTVKTGSGMRELIPSASRPDAVGAVRLRNGEVVTADTVIIAAGIKPSVELAREAGIAVGQGIKVNTELRTSIENIYAVGECAEFGGQIYGLVAPGLEQAAVAADRFAGGSALYLGSISAAKLKVAGEHVFSAGVVNEDESSLPLQSVIYEDVAHRAYRKLLVCRGQLVGALGYGKWDETPRIQEAVIQRRRVFFWQLQRFARSGSLWAGDSQDDVASWPASAVVCNCRGITRAELSGAIAAGCNSVELLARETGAASVCGSCENLLQNMTGAAGKPSRAPASLGTAMATVCSLGLLFLLTRFRPGVSQSVQLTPWWEQVWSDGFFKQLTGFSMLALIVIGLLVSLKKRVFISRLGHFNYWRLGHMVAGVFILALLVLHTGFEAGDNLNRYLLYNFLALTAAGALAGTVVSTEKQMSLRQGKRFRSLANWAHILLSWPLPVLLTFHIVSVYYF